MAADDLTGILKYFAQGMLLKVMGRLVDAARGLFHVFGDSIRPNGMQGVRRLIRNFCRTGHARDDAVLLLVKKSFCFVPDGLSDGPGRLGGRFAHLLARMTSSIFYV